MTRVEAASRGRFLRKRTGGKLDIMRGDGMRKGKGVRDLRKMGLPSPPPLLGKRGGAGKRAFGGSKRGGRLGSRSGTSAFPDPPFLGAWRS